jgi:translation initiation factor IF-3
MAYMEQGEELIKRVIERTQDVAKVEAEMKMEGRNMNMILAPVKIKTKKK